jgi:hypothetical protein
MPVACDMLPRFSDHFRCVLRTEKMGGFSALRAIAGSGFQDSLAVAPSRWMAVESPAAKLAHVT